MSYLKNLLLFYMLQSVLLQFLSDESYEKYVRFFLGLVFILMILEPFVNQEFLREMRGQFLEVIR